MKQAEMNVDKLIVIILVVLVILAIAMFLFKADIVNYMRGLPGVYRNDTDIEVTLTDEQLESIGCEVPIAKMGSEQLGAWYSRYSVDDRALYIYDAKTRKFEVYGTLYFHAHSEDDIKIYYNSRKIDPVIGEIKDKKVVITSYGEDSGASYQSVLKNLNGAVLHPEINNYLCKKKEVKKWELK